ncbi:MAG TPA: isoprenylcysteine carboxylmethyltransferase family protein [Anaerolineales bacterium]|nr:isoprenylcysteine carboxylmethyltransferase family protein [Anaerolineales bacterium]
MEPWVLFRVAFFVLLGAMLIMRVAFSLRVHQQGERSMPDRQAIQHEGLWLFVARVVLFFMLIAVLVLYAMNHTWMKELEFELPGWLRWTGFAIGCLSIGLVTWAELELGRQFSPQLQLRQEHQLITTGPYAYIRHPIYTAIYGFGLSLAMVSANWFFVGFFLLSMIGLGVRVPKEERMLMEQFGEEYRVYMEKTGRYGPRL